MEKEPFVQQGDTNASAHRRQALQGLSPEARRLVEEDARFFLHQALSSPVMNALARTEGAYIYDVDGKAYLDLHGNGVHNVGFHHPEVVAAARRQLEARLAFTPRRYTNQPAVQLAERLVGAAPPGLDRALFCPGGSEAVEMALLLAKQVTGKWKTISFWDNYHGTTLQAAAVGGTRHFLSGYGPGVPGAFHVEFPNYYRNPWGIDPADTEAIDAQYLREMRVIAKRHPDLAAIIGTTITSTPCVPSQNYWEGVREICRGCDALLIFDEIVCGLGRTGKLFACEHYLTPDILVLGKALGGGLLPLAGILAREELNVLPHRSIGHFTHEKNPLAAAVGLATLKAIEAEGLVDRAARLGQYLQESLRELSREFPLIGHVEGEGLLIAVDLVRDPQTKERAKAEAERIMYHCLERGLSFKIIDGNVITLRPALIIDQGEADFIVRTLRSALASL